MQSVLKDASRGSTAALFGLEEMAARTLFKAKRSKFLVPERM
jgi:hypothetical protein